MRILSLGGAGFIGSYLARELLSAGHQLTLVDNFSKYGFLEHDFLRAPEVTLKIADVRALPPRDFAGYDAVVCLAALIGGIRYFHRIPYRIARENTEILGHAIDCTLAASPKARFVYFSSSMVFERIDHPAKESDVREQKVPVTNYGMQKLFGEYVVRGAGEEQGLHWLIVRPFNAVGAGELPDMKSDGEVEFGSAHVLPDFAWKAIRRQTPFEILGDGEQVRTFTHGKDIASGVRLALEKGVEGEDFNLCGEGTTVKVGELARKVWAAANPGEPFPAIRHLDSPPSDVRFRIGVAEKAKKALGWAPRVGLDEIIADTVGYLKAKGVSRK